MNISNKTDITKLYSRNKYSDGLPHTSDDIHNEQDLLLKKLGLLLESKIGSGLLEKVSLTNTSGGIYLNKLVPVNLDGDIFLLGTSKNDPMISLEGKTSGTVMLICWYRNVSGNSILYEYGCTNNDTVTNDILNEKLSIQTSSKYQVYWCLGTTNNVINYEETPGSKFTCTGSFVTVEGDYYTNGSFEFDINDRVGKFYRTNKKSLSYIEGDYIYALPIANIVNGTAIPLEVPNSMNGTVSKGEPDHVQSKVWYNPDTDEVKMYFNNDWRDVGGSQIIKSETEPTGNIKDGTFWYKPSLNEFKIYVTGVGFVETYAKMGFVQIQGTYEFNQTISTPSNITLGIPIDTYLSTDVLRISYEGAELVGNGVNYSINIANKTITLLNFTANSGDKVTFVATRLVGSSDLSTTLDLLNDHTATSGNLNSKGHVKLSDTPNNSYDNTTGFAATPKAVKSVENKINKYTDSSNNRVYELGVTNGLLFIREVNQ